MKNGGNFEIMNTELVMRLTETAAAAAEGTPEGYSAAGGAISMLVSMGFLILVFYLFILRPEKKKEKEKKAMKESLQIGDEVTTIGGITGIIIRINRNAQNPHDDTVVIETGGDRNKVRVKMWAISENATQHDAAEEGGK